MTDYEARALAHRPQTVEEVRSTVRSMLAAGYSDYGTAAALRIAVEQVRRLACFDERELGEHA